MKLLQETETQTCETLRQIDLSAATRDHTQQYIWLKEKRKPTKIRRKREPESLNLF